MCFSYDLLKIYQNIIFLPTYFYLNNGFKRLSISANRYVLICKPFSHRTVTSQKSTLIQITTLTVFALSAGIFELYLHWINWIAYNMCLLIIIVMSTVLPLIISIVLTILVIREFRRMNRTLEDSVRTGVDSRQGEKNVTRTMRAVNVAFFVRFATNSTSCYLVHILSQFKK